MTPQQKQQIVQALLGGYQIPKTVPLEARSGSEMDASFAMSRDRLAREQQNRRLLNSELSKPQFQGVAEPQMKRALDAKMRRDYPQWSPSLGGMEIIPAGAVQGGAGQAQIKGQQGGDTLSPQEMRGNWDEQVADAYDKDAAKLALEWMAEGKNADVAKSLSQLREAKARLESGADNISGPVVGSWLGQAVAPAINPESVITKEAIEEVVQRNLRLVLGAQFTEREGERLISRAFNPKLQEPENAKRVGRLLRSIEDAALAREAAAQHFMKHGTLVGWDGRIPGIADIEASIEDTSEDGWVTLPNGMRVREKQ